MKCNAANPKESGHVDIWQETFPVRFGSIDKSDRLTLSAMFQFFQEAAICHAENLDAGREDLAKAGQVWILSRISVTVDRRPAYRELVTVRTWPRGSEKLFAIRDYDIRDKDDIPAVAGRSGWLVVDIEKRRPLRPQAVVNLLPANEGVNALNWGPASLEERADLQKIMERKALYTDIDYNGHVNNVRYIQWIEDAVDPGLLEAAGKMRLDINYLNEIRGDETIDILSAPVADEKAFAAFAFDSRKHETNQSAFRAELRLYK
uniref:Acyl-ACP thioesterase-like protein n=1 Tax=uncultured bacterium contig00027 TaxID=1181516 RepID=A0A806KK67_9BACT|nr:acyl-ACP thioesterase-like protein [uncultured bacterium contig00027]